MNIRFHYLDRPSVTDWDVLKAVWRERPDNLLTEHLSIEHAAYAEKLQTTAEPLLLEQNVALLTELAAHTNYMWSTNRRQLKVYFFEDSDRAKKVMGIAEEWNQHCGLHFVRTWNREESDIRVSFTPKESWSKLGACAIGVSKMHPTMNFGWLLTGLGEEDYRAVVLHEFGHALGLIHEHQREDAEMDWNKTLVRLHFQDHTPEWIEHNVFKAVPQVETNHSSQVDLESIMAYPIPPALSKSGKGFPFNTKLSPIDIEHIKCIYPPKGDLIHS
jgi:serralysin